MPVTINGGYKMPAWYDILHMDIGAEVEEKTNRSHIVEDIAGMERTRKSCIF
jgi:phospholipase/carboxylesterase